MKIALLGTRGVPATYGGFETAVEEIGSRLAARGDEVTVFGSGPSGHYRGMTCVKVPHLRIRQLETLSRTASCIPWLLREGFDAVIIFNVANVPLLSLIRAKNRVLNLDGLESQRSKWSSTGRRYFRMCERIAAWSGRRGSVALVADSRGICRYYKDHYLVEPTVIAYGAPVLNRWDVDRSVLSELRLMSGRYHLVVARLEPENNVREIVQAYTREARSWPLVVVGGNPYRTPYVVEVESAARQPGILLAGPIYDQTALNSLYFFSGSYVHGHSVGGTNPSLLRAHGAGCRVLAFDCVYNREVSRGFGHYWSNPDELVKAMRETEEYPLDALPTDAALRDVTERYNWDNVTEAYRRLLLGEVTLRIEPE